MVADDALLMAYVDGELSSQQNQELERLIDASPDLAERVSRLMASCLPYEEAFARQNLPPVPESLKLNIAALAAQHTAEPAPSRSAEVSDEKTDSVFSRLFAFFQPKFAWPALTFVAGAACYALVLQVGAFSGALKPGIETTAPAVAAIWATFGLLFAASKTKAAIATITGLKIDLHLIVKHAPFSSEYPRIATSFN